MDRVGRAGERVGETDVGVDVEERAQGRSPQVGLDDGDPHARLPIHERQVAHQGGLALQRHGARDHQLAQRAVR
jgi:hypothetical protein